MRLRSAIVGFVVLAGSAAAAHAETLAAGPLKGGSNQKSALCSVLNAGDGLARILTFQILQSPGNTPLPVQSSSCIPGAFLPAGASCVFTAAVGSEPLYSCKVTVEGPAANWRGVLSLSSNPQILNSTDLR